MIRNYLKVALRYLLRYKQYTAINILGLAVGITCCILIMLFVRSEFSYDKFHSKADRIYRVWQDEKYEDQRFINSVTPFPMAGALQSSFGEIDATCRIYSFSPMVKYADNTFSESMRMVDSTFLKIFDFPLVAGNRNDPFPTSNSILLTEETAKKYFGKADPMGKSVEIQLGDQKIMFSVSGIIGKAPEESSIKYNALIPYSNAKFIFRPGAMRSWFNVAAETYVLLGEKANAAALEKKFPSMMKKQLGERYTEGGFMVYLQPITRIHLQNDIPVGNAPVSDPKYSYIMITIGTLILLVACINFITLSIGRSSSRAMEVGVRKVLGAERKQLIGQFWGEAFLLTLISVILGLGIAAMLVKPFNQLISRELHIQFDFVFILFCLLIIGLIALIAGIYPAIILSGFKPVEVLKGKLKLKSNKNLFRQSLTVGQFVASIAMIICTIAISKQMNYMQNKDLGYKKDQVIVVQTNQSRAKGFALAELYKNEIRQDPSVVDAGISLISFAEASSWITLGYTDEHKAYRSFQYNSVMPDFIKTMKLQMVQGRAFSSDNTADIGDAAIVNEAFIKEFGITDPIGKKLPGPFEQQIVGVIKDFNYESLHTKIKPLLLTIRPDSVFRRTENIDFSSSTQPRISVRMKPGSIEANLTVLKNAWKKVAPTQEFAYDFLDDKLAAQYQTEKRTNTVIRLASGLSIFIACLGLFGLATLSVVRRTKEIGIRKVLGASISSIVQLISKDFVKLIIIAAVIAFPLAWWTMDSWLQDFEYRTTVSWWIYITAGILVLLIAILTVSFQAIKAAISNPVKSLRTE